MFVAGWLCGGLALRRTRSQCLDFSSCLFAVRFFSWGVADEQPRFNGTALTKVHLPMRSDSVGAYAQNSDN